MNEEKIRSVLLGALARIAPEVDLAGVDPAADLREQVDLDSVDFFNFVVAVDRELGVAIPEADYPRLRTLDDCVAYLSARAESGAASD